MRVNGGGESRAFPFSRVPGGRGLTHVFRLLRE